MDKARRAGTIWIKLITRHSKLTIEISHWGSYLIFSPWFPSPFHKTWHRFEHITVTEQYPHCYKCESREPQHSGWWPWLCSRLQASSDTSCGKELCIVAQLFHIRPLVTLACWGSVPCHCLVTSDRCVGDWPELRLRKSEILICLNTSHWRNSLVFCSETIAAFLIVWMWPGQFPKQYITG